MLLRTKAKSENGLRGLFCSERGHYRGVSTRSRDSGAAFSVRWCYFRCCVLFCRIFFLGSGNTHKMAVTNSSLYAFTKGFIGMLSFWIAREACTCPGGELGPG